MHLIARMCLALFAVGILAAAEDPIASLRFTDGALRTTADFSGQNVYLWTFCSH